MSIRRVNNLARRMKKIQEARMPNGIVIIASNDQDAKEKLESTKAQNIVMIVSDIDASVLDETEQDILNYFKETDPVHYARIVAHKGDTVKEDQTEGLLKWVKGDILYTRIDPKFIPHEQDLSGLSPIVRGVLTKDAVTLH
ncbi:hypothetical protein [Bacillus cereus group sp. BfR-BA-01318]|uniref:hypothetical protein n=1 Tax=Bacillus cereus group sp. BfR-BA-01318 TaxID=2920295 RepID=UPI001F58A8E3|nr:hypothetical protein [Bacillus cereus group sp. BfR-BA-01318]